MIELHNKFSEWLARGYNRPAFPDNIVNAIQKPIVKGIDKLPLTSLNSTPLLMHMLKGSRRGDPGGRPGPLSRPFLHTPCVDR